VLAISNILTNLTFVSQNTNSLNVSTNCPKQLEKILSILDSKADVIFLSDIRLNNSAMVEDLSKFFLNSDRHYDFFYNSTKASRGVGILISRDCAFNILGFKKDHEENILAIRCSKNDVIFNLIGVYGPNADDRTFFNFLTNYLNTENALFNIQ